MPPHLTKTRWMFLTALKHSPALLRRPFLAHELKYKKQTARGATLVALEQAGWVERTVWGAPGQGMPFKSGGPVTAWQVTPAGLNSIKTCPDTFPGAPVYDKEPLK